MVVLSAGATRPRWTRTEPNTLNDGARGIDDRRRRPLVAEDRAARDVGSETAPRSRRRRRTWRSTAPGWRCCRRGVPACPPTSTRRPAAGSTTMEARPMMLQFAATGLRSDQRPAGPHRAVHEVVAARVDRVVPLPRRRAGCRRACVPATAGRCWSSRADRRGASRRRDGRRGRRARRRRRQRPRRAQRRGDEAWCSFPRTAWTPSEPGLSMRFARPGVRSLRPSVDNGHGVRAAPAEDPARGGRRRHPRGDRARPAPQRLRRRHGGRRARGTGGVRTRVAGAGAARRDAARARRRRALPRDPPRVADPDRLPLGALGRHRRRAGPGGRRGRLRHEAVRARGAGRSPARQPAPGDGGVDDHGAGARADRLHRARPRRATRSAATARRSA